MEPQGQVLHARFGDVCVLKFVGSIGFTANWAFPLSKALRVFLDKLFAEKDFENIVVDLTEATGIDSTNLGLLAEVARFSKEEFNRKATLIVREGRVSKALHVTGFDALYSIFIMDAPIQGKLQPVPEVPDADVDVAKLILNAHLTLSEMNEENRKLFQNVVDALEADILRKEGLKP
jgi:anti-anti-sigma regulatory factor